MRVSGVLQVLIQRREPRFPRFAKGICLGLAGKPFLLHLYRGFAGWRGVSAEGKDACAVRLVEPCTLARAGRAHAERIRLQPCGALSVIGEGRVHPLRRRCNRLAGAARLAAIGPLSHRPPLNDLLVLYRHALGPPLAHA